MAFPEFQKRNFKFKCCFDRYTAATQSKLNLSSLRWKSKEAKRHANWVYCLACCWFSWQTVHGAPLLLMWLGCWDKVQPPGTLSAGQAVMEWKRDTKAPREEKIYLVKKNKHVFLISHIQPHDGLNKRLKKSLRASTLGENTSWSCRRSL